jgi:DNA adenine methylase
LNYLGGKHYSARHFEQFLRSAYDPSGVYYEPFLGGAHVLLRVDRFAAGARVISDVNNDLIALWRAVADGFRVPEAMSLEQWKELRDGPSCPLRTAAGFGLSFSGKWFGGYAAASRPAKAMYPCQALNRAFSRAAGAIRRSDVRACSYESLSPGAGDLVYCDPPYAGTTGYDAVGSFDHTAFWYWAENAAERGARVFVSEYNAPAGWRPVWSKAVSSCIKTVARRSTTADLANEKLFTRVS